MDKNIEFVSIIIPTYNRINVLIKAVESCMQQSYRNIEVIIVDDGSTDGTEAEILRLLKSDWQTFNINYYRKTNSGASAARNYGLNLAKGHYIQFLDSDDILFKDKLKLQIEYIETHKLEGCSCYGYMGESLKDKNGLERIGQPFSSISDLIDKLCNGVHVMQTSAPLWRKDLLEKADGWDEQLGFGDDLEYHLRALLSTKRFKFFDEYLFFLRVHQHDRLSDASGNIGAILSGIKTQMKIVEILRAQNHWTAKINKGINKSCRTLYVNLLDYKSRTAIVTFESWLLQDLEITSRSFKAMIVGRKVVGISILAFLIKTLLKLKA